jgi:cytidylate kinase
MRMTGSPRALAESIVHAHAYRQSAHERGQAANAPGFTIAISRETGAGGTSVANEVGMRLGWPVYDHALLERMAQEMNLRAPLLESVDERRLTWLEECLEQFSLVPMVSENLYVKHLIQTVLSLGTHGACIIVGRGASFILPPATTLRVRLVASREDRVVRIAQERSLSHEAAAQFVERRDRERHAFARDHFLTEPHNSVHYDLVLNTSRLSYADCAEVIIDTLHRLERQPRNRAEASPLVSAANS